MEDPILHPEKIPDFISKTDNALVDIFKIAASSLRVQQKVKGATYYFPDFEISQPENQQKAKENEVTTQPQGKEADFKQNETKKEEKTKIIEIKPQKEPAKTEKMRKREVAADQKQKEFKELKIEGVPDESATFPPPVPNDNDPVRNKMLHAWYWAGYYTALYDAQCKK